MSLKNKPIIQAKSSQKVAKFLEKNNLHKKDFAEMIGVTLSYVYNLIDETIPFSTRSTTLERIATVMDIKPEEFEEYKIPQEPILQDDTIELLKSMLHDKKMSIVTFLKAFPRKKRVDIVYQGNVNEEGYAKVMMISPNVKNSKYYRQIEKQAKENNAGFWNGFFK